MRRFRTFILIAFACLLLLAVGTVAASASHHTTSSDQKAKLSAPVAHVVQLGAAMSAKKGTTYVYITKTGTKYHRSGCRYLAHSKIKKTLKWAKSHGYDPCKVCKPPK